jgi:hypothetical protein
MPSAWEGNWPDRIRERVAEQGYESPFTFAEAKPKATFIELANELGEDVAPIQLEGVICDDYDKRGEAERYARGSLVRHLRDEIPDGWGIGANFDFKRSGVYASWSSRLPEGYEEDADRVWAELKQTPRLYQGWLPEGPDDEILVEVFKKVGFTSKKAA